MPDAKLELSNTASDISPSDSIGSNGEANGELQVLQASWRGDRWRTFKESFKREAPREYDLENNDVESKSEGNAISNRHVVMLALAGGLGTGLLVGVGGGLARSGPAGLLMAFTIVGAMVYLTMGAAGELAVAYSAVPGGFNSYARRLVDPSLSFAVAWNYCINWFTVLPLELVTASMTIKFWDPHTNADLYVSILLVMVCIINFIGARGYAEAEFWANSIKVTMLVGFIVLGILMDVGICGTQGKVLFKYFSNPGPFANGFKGVCAVLVTCAFSLGGTEFMALSAADQKKPRRAIPSAVKQVGYRLIFVYLLSILLIGMLVPYDSPFLMGSGGNRGAPVSPFVIAVNSGSIKALPHIINAVILVALFSVANAALYCSSRTFYSLAQQGYAPKWFDFVDRKKRPTRAMLLSSTLGLFSLIAAYPDQESIFVWLLSLSGLASLFTWGTINISFLRMRSAMKVQGFSTSELGYVSYFGTPGSWVAIVIIVGTLVSHFWVSLFPFETNGVFDPVNFFQNYSGFPVLLVFYISHKVYTRNWRVCIPADEIDLVTDRKIFDADVIYQEHIEEERRLKEGPLFKRIVAFWC